MSSHILAEVAQTVDNAEVAQTVDNAEVAQTVDNVVILDHGHLVIQSSLAELTADGTVGLEQAFLRLTSGPGGSAGPAGRRIRPSQEVTR